MKKDVNGIKKKKPCKKTILCHMIKEINITKWERQLIHSSKMLTANIL